MTDWCKSITFPGIFHWVKFFLNLVQQYSWCFAKIQWINNSYKNSTANGQFLLKWSHINSRKPCCNLCIQSTYNWIVPRSNFCTWYHISRANVTVPNPCYFQISNTVNFLHCFNISCSVSTKGLFIEAVKITLSEYFGIFFIFTRYQYFSKLCGLQSFNIFHRYHITKILIANCSFCFTLNLILPRCNLFNYRIIYITDIEPLTSHINSCRGELTFQNSFCCGFRGQSSVLCKQHKKFPCSGITVWIFYQIFQLNV